MGNVLSCDTVHWEVWTKVYSPQVASPWQAKVQLPPKFSLVSLWASLGLLTGIKVRGYGSSNDSKSAHLGMGDNSQKLKTWSTRYSLQNRLGMSFPAKETCGCGTHSLTHCSCGHLQKTWTRFAENWTNQHSPWMRERAHEAFPFPEGLLVVYRHWKRGVSSLMV